MGDIMAISRLATKVYTAYKDGPNDYKGIAQGAKSLQIAIDIAAEHFENTSLRGKKLQDFQELVKECHSVLGELNSLVEKYQCLAPANARKPLKRVMLSTEDIPALRERLLSSITCLNLFIQRYDNPTIPRYIVYGTNITSILAVDILVCRHS